MSCCRAAAHISSFASFVCLLRFFLSLFAISTSFRCLFVIAWPNASPSLPALLLLLLVFHLPSATCHFPLATCLLCAVLAHVYSILSLPVPLDLRGMLTAICMESSSCLAWLARLLASTELSSAPLGRRPNVTLVYLPAEKPPSPSPLKQKLWL